MRVDVLNAVCPYYTMYPLRFPLGVLQSAGSSGDRRDEWVIDPFCGRGTTNFAARLLQMPSVGVDSSPVAAALAQAKLVYAKPADVLESARDILSAGQEPHSIPRDEFWQLAYHEETLRQLCQLRDGLIARCSSPARVLLRAILLGALHGPRPRLTRWTPTYFSNQSPRTFAPKPAYAVKFWTERGLRPQAVDVLQIIARRAERYLSQRLPDVDGRVQLADSREARTFQDLPKARWIITSPPYYGMRSYLPDQWLRLWFLGGPEHVDYRQPPGQLAHSGAGWFAGELARVWKNMAAQAAPGAHLVIRFGGIHDRHAEPMDILTSSLQGSGWRIETTTAVPPAHPARRQAQQFQASPRTGITEHDVCCRLA